MRVHDLEDAQGRNGGTKRYSLRLYGELMDWVASMEQAAIGFEGRALESDDTTTNAPAKKNNNRKQQAAAPVRESGLSDAYFGLIDDQNAPAKYTNGFLLHEGKQKLAQTGQFASGKMVTPQEKWLVAVTLRDGRQFLARYTATKANCQGCSKKNSKNAKDGHQPRCLVSTNACSTCNLYGHTADTCCQQK